MTLFETDRLALRELMADDAAFILDLLNDPDWIKYIGNRNVHNLAQARDYIEKGPRAMYAQHGFGLWLVETKTDKVPTGICGLIKRESLDDVDLGFAFLPAYRSQGYALEAARASLNYAQHILGLNRIVAITTPDNAASMRLLSKLGFGLVGPVQPNPAEPPLQLFALARA